jgi:putative transport protein
LSPTITLLSIIAAGLALGRLSVLGISFGSSAILFVALVAGHFKQTIPSGIGTLGLALFVFCVGLSAGPTFFRGLASQGRAMATLGGMIVLLGGIVTWLSATLFDLPPELAGGLMAGAMTSTPALGAISETVADPAKVAVGFGVAYPIGIVAIVLFVQLAMKWMPRENVDESKHALQIMEDSESIHRQAIEIANPGVVGRSPNDMAIFADANCQISRLLIDDRWRPLPSPYEFAMGDRLLLVGQERDIREVADTLGVIRDDNGTVIDADRERKTVVVTSPNFYGRSLKDLSLRSQHGVTVARIRRHEIEFVPSGQTVIEFGDTLTLVGEPMALKKIESVVGHRLRALNETDLLSLAGGLICGILLGEVALNVAGLSISLGTAGGPLMVGIILGHFRRIGPIRGSFPPAAQLLLTEGGLALFLADAGVTAGENVVAELTQHGFILCAVAASIAIIPMVIGFFVSRKVMRLTWLQALGTTCGGMTSTPGLAVLTGATESSQPVTSYVAAYPIALVAITIAGPVLINVLMASWVSP